MAKWKLDPQGLNIVSAGGEAVAVYNYTDGVKSNTQKVDETTGLPLWRQAVLIVGDPNEPMKAANISYSAKTPAVVQQLQPITFGSLELTVVGRDAGEYLRATDISVATSK